MDWWEQGACNGADADLFFSETKTDWRVARMYCAACPVRQKCLDYAIANDERYGIWGGLTRQARDQVRDTRRRLRSVS
jgi:WhiB family redox-sensing transcriptional regulator